MISTAAIVGLDNTPAASTASSTGPRTDPAGVFTAAALDDRTAILKLRAVERRLNRPTKPSRRPEKTTAHSHRADARGHRGTYRAVQHVGDPSDAQWDQLRQCEASGDYKLHDPPFYGAYQFDLGTWADVGGTGNPASASPAEQDYRARKLYHERGRQPWPVCGKYLA